MDYSKPGIFTWEKGTLGLFKTTTKGKKGDIYVPLGTSLESRRKKDSNHARNGEGQLKNRGK